MTEYETASLAIANAGLTVAYATLAVSALALIPQSAAAIGIWFGIRAMNRGNAARAAQAAEDGKQAAEDRKITQAMLASLETTIATMAANLERQGASLEASTAALAASLERQGASLEAATASLERQGRALEELLRRGNAH